MDTTGKRLISVIIPIYNTKNYLERCIDSILQQTYTNLEIILVDDGSNDGSEQICDNYAKLDKRIRVIHKENGKQNSARNAGLKIATGEYISYIDSDDWIEKETYEELNKIVDQYQPDLIECFFQKEFKGISSTREIMMEEGYYTKDKIIQGIENMLQVTPPFVYAVHSVVWSKLIKKTFLLQHQFRVPDNLMIGEDFAISFPLLMNADTIYYTHQAFYHYCVRETSTIYQKNSNKFENYVRINEFFIKCLNGKDEIFQKYYIYRSFDLLFDYLLSIPEDYFINREYFPFFDGVRRNSSLIIYGKGLYAQNIIEVITKTEFAQIVANVDSADVEARLESISGTQYDYILVAIGDHKIAHSVRNYLTSLGVMEEKIKMIDNKFIMKENLPDEIRRLYDLIAPIQ